jgi:hypothetical protein
VLNAYITNTQNLLQAPGSAANLYPTASLTTWINIARGQLAGESRCIRVIGTLATVVGQRAYNFSSINIGTTASTGIQGVINVRRVMYNVATGQKWVKGKSWPWFDFQRFNNPVPGSGAPTEWAQYGQGSSGQGSITGVGSGTLSSGSLYVDPLPDIVYTLNCDCIGYPQALAADTDVEAIPYLWTDAVPYFAAYLALMSAQTGQRIQEAQQMFQLYQQFVARARDFANPDLNNYAFEQSPDPTMTNRLAISGGRGAQ